MEFGYSAAPLIKKLDIKPGFRIYIKNEIPGYFDLIGQMPENVVVENKLYNEFNFIHNFCKSRFELFNEIKKLKLALKKDGMLWISWPKKTSKIFSDLDENIIRNIGLEAGLVDIKVCAIDKNWSALKFVYRKKDRKL